ncbi:MAG: penicillin-binding protein, partial [Chitinophagaceae bacterium]
SAYIMKQVGPREFSDFISKLNIPTKIDAFPSMALGAMDLSLFEMMWGYSVFAGRGFSTRPVFITRIEDRNGNVIKRFDLGSNRQEAVSELTSYNMTRMMQGTVDIGTAKGLRSRLGASEMGGKTGTTNDNADAWFMGYTPQLLAGVWIGCDDRFIRIENGLGYGGQAAMPIWEGFFRKVYADKSLGIDKDAHFAQPADFTNMVNSADPMAVDITVPPEGEGVDQGVGNANDYEYGGDTIGSESVPFKDENDKTPAKKDTSGKKSPKQSDKPIGSATEEKKSRKGGFLKDLFRKRDKD